MSTTKQQIDALEKRLESKLSPEQRSKDMIYALDNGFGEKLIKMITDAIESSFENKYIQNTEKLFGVSLNTPEQKTDFSSLFKSIKEGKAKFDKLKLTIIGSVLLLVITHIVRTFLNI